MKIKLFSAATVAALALFSCAPQPVQERGARPVKLATVTSLESFDKSYSGVVSADQFSDLAFKMGGPIVKMNVIEGQRISKGEVVAEIDPQDFELDYSAKNASYIKAKSQMERAERLLAKSAISLQEYETSEATFINAKSAMKSSRNNLEETKLRAPFSGFIQKKYAENYQRVQSGQGVVCLVNPSKLQVQFTIPETNIPYVTNPNKIFVEFDAYRGELFEATIKEYVEASADGAGVPVFLYITDKKFDLAKYKISVGFSCRVVVNIKGESMSDALIVPISSIVYDNANKSTSLYVYNPSTKCVERRKVTNQGTIIGRTQLAVVGDVKVGESVVAAGASMLADGIEVKILAE